MFSTSTKPLELHFETMAAEISASDPTSTTCRRCDENRSQTRGTPQRKRRRDEHRLLAVVKYPSKRYVPIASIVALLVTWIGLFLFCSKLYAGMLDLEEQSQGLFKFLLPYLKGVRQATVVTAIIMTAITLMMAVVGLFATLHCDHCYRGRLASCVCSKLGSRVMCGVFWALSYLLNLCWMVILSLLVVMTSAYFAFMPVCLPQSGAVDTYCLNFTILSNLMVAGNEANSVNLLLCGGAIDKLCKLTKAIVPWYWGAYLGCLAVLLGLSHFNGSLAANFAHGKHAIRYVKIRDRTSSTVEWTKDWRVKSLTYFDLITDSSISLRPKSVRPPNGSPPQKIANGHLPVGRRRDSTSCSEMDSDLEQPSQSIDLKASTGSIVLSFQGDGDLTRRPLALPAPPKTKSNGDSRSPPPPLPPYKPRPISALSNGSSNFRPPVPPKPRSTSETGSQSSNLGNGFIIKEIQV